eukprot:GFUD01000324.1.p2 GENE.GFUD01000324.1~~GFUD01000324.1.p2  ORF type:complete len:195 (-),score=80.51 GFUD01000324.1:90-674(-)
MSNATQSTDSHLYWLSCNRCSTRFLPPQAGKRMFLSSCGCIYCMRCVQASTQAGCITCRAAPGKVLPIGKNLPQQVVEMFNRNEESLAKINKRSSFQNRHYNRCLKLLTEAEKGLAEQINAEEREARKRQVEMKMMNEKIREKQMQVDRLESALLSLKITSSPVNMDYITSLPVPRHRCEREGMGRGGGGERLF